MEDLISSLGVGKRTTDILAEAGYATIGDLFYCTDLHGFKTNVANVYASVVFIQPPERLETSVRAFVSRCTTLYYRIKHAQAAPILPEWMCDPITYDIMEDPVTTPNGQTYERTTIERIITEEGTGLDPFTREVISLSDLRPNLQLREAIEFHRAHFMLFARFSVPLRRPGH